MTRQSHHDIDVSEDLMGDAQVDEMEGSARRKPDHDIGYINNRLFFRLFQLGNTLQRQAVKELGVSTVQWAVLGALSRTNAKEGMSFAELADYLVVSRQNLDGVLKRLERDSHVLRVTDQTDKRARLVRLTPQGRRFWASLQPRIYEFYRQAMSQFRFDDSVAFVHYLNRLQTDLVKVKLP
jgi:DNA-binding MarR family transcriptional regulator